MLRSAAVSDFANRLLPLPCSRSVTVAVGLCHLCVPVPVSVMSTAEPPELAFPVKADTDANYVKLLEMLLSEEARQNGVYIGIATHDEKMIQAAIKYVQENNISRDAFEFQMLYGIRRELQEMLVQQGYRIRIYVPYGTAWYPYFVRRLAERPANLWFFVSNLIRN